MAEFENVIIKPLITTGIIAFYKRYIDDTIVLAKPCDLDIILKQFNSFHPQIQFTIDPWREILDMNRGAVGFVKDSAFFGVCRNRIIFKMAARRSSYSAGFFRDLNKLSCADFYTRSVGHKRKRTLDNGRLFVVERVITSRQSRDMNEKEYLIKWANYSPFEATWEPQRHLNYECLKYFENPTPDRDVVLHEVSRLRIAVAHALKASKVRQTLTVEFRQDVYLYLFGRKGYQQGKWRVLEKDDFLAQYFYPNQWDSFLDQHGQGTKVHYPVKVRHYISWSPKGFIRNSNIIEAARAYQEKLSIQMVKVVA